MIPDKIIKRAQKWRKELHQTPELSGKEYQTAQKISAFLTALDPASITTNLGGHGILVCFDNGLPGPSLMFRTELDALPIEEVNTFEHRSKVSGVSHKCGHDGHMSILLGLAIVLSRDENFRGKVYLLFQPAEETGAGAMQVLAENRFTSNHFDFVYALHNLPGHPMGEIVCKQGAITASVKSVIFRLSGKTSHAAEPEKGINPSVAIAKILQFLPEVTIADPAEADFSLLTPVHLNMGEKAYGVSAGYGEVHLTLRAWTEARMEYITDELLSFVEEVCEEEKLQLSYDWTDSFQSNENNEMAMKHIRKAADALGYDYKRLKTPFKWGEDFGAFTQQYQGAFFGLGAGENTPALHNPDYDFPDELIKPGISMFYQIIKTLTS